MFIVVILQSIKILGTTEQNWLLLSSSTYATAILHIAIF